MIRRLIARFLNRPTYETWEETPTAWLFVFLINTAIPVAGGAAFLVSILPELVKTSQQFGIGLAGALIWSFIGLITLGVWLGRNVMKRCSELIYQRLFR